MVANGSDGSASFTCNRESSNSTPVHVVMEKDLEKPTFCDDPTLNQVASMPYRHRRVSIFKKADRFFYEPIVLLEEIKLPKQQRRDGRVEATLKIKLWNYDLERRVISYLRCEVGEVGLKNHQVQMMPYEEVRLVAKKTTSSFRVLTGPLCLLQLPMDVMFNLLFSLGEEAEFSTEYLADHFELHFAGQSSERLQGTAKKDGEDVATLHRDSAFRVYRNSVFGINIDSQSIGSREDEEATANNFGLDDVPSKIRKVDDRANGWQIKNGASVPVIGASAYEPISRSNYVIFADLTLPAEEIRGVFDKTTGVFTARTCGKYLFKFQGFSWDCESIEMKLKANGIKKWDPETLQIGGVTIHF